MHVLVTGASGFVGGRLVPILRDRGHDVTALVRDADRPVPWDREDDGGIRLVEGDLLEPGSFEDAFAPRESGDGEPEGDTEGKGSRGDTNDEGSGVDKRTGHSGDDAESADGTGVGGVEAAYYLVHSMRAGEDFEERDRRAAENFAAAASDAGVERVVYLGGLGEDRDELSAHLRSRREVERVLGEGDYELTTLRAAIVIGEGSASFEVVRQLAARLPVMVTPRWVRTPCQPIAVDDVVAYLAGVLDAPETAGETYEIGGPDVLTYGEILARTRRAIGGRLFLLPVPFLTPRLSAYWIGLVTDVPLSVARPLVEGLRNPVVVTDDSIEDHVVVDRTPFEEALQRALAGKGAPG